MSEHVPDISKRAFRPERFGRSTAPAVTPSRAARVVRAMESGHPAYDADIEAALEVDLLLDHVEERALNVASEAIEAANAASGAVDSNVPEQVVLAGEEHLEETKFSRVSFCGVLIIIIGQQAG